MGDNATLLTDLGLLFAISLPACAYAGYIRLTRGKFLPYQRRWPVPWGGVGGVLALSLLALSVLELLSAEPPSDKVAAAMTEVSVSEYVQGALLSFGVSLGFVVMVGLFLVSTTGATLSDLGVVLNRRVLLRDAVTGVVAALVALLPVYGFHALLIFGLGLESEHPTLLRLLADPNPLVLLAALLTAGVAAPVFEEFVFRLLFQGWLERVEDESLGLAGRLEMEDNEQEEEERDLDASDVIEEALPDPDNPNASPQTRTLRRLMRRQGEPPTPPEETFAGLPHGWGPILISSFVFALVHIGQGAAPAPLFFLALVLGYLYQRTHRITPSIAAHVTFNVISLLITWAQAG